MVKILSKKEKRDLEQLQKKLRKKSYNLGDLCPGTIYENWTTCGKPNCKCKKGGGKHGPYHLLSFTGREDKRMITILVSKDDVSRIQERIMNFKKLEKEVRELVQIELKLKKQKKGTK